MSKITFVLAPVSLLLISSCMQLSQQAVGPIPPPAPETLCRPVPAEQQEYYTLPKPIRN